MASLQFGASRPGPWGRVMGFGLPGAVALALGAASSAHATDYAESTQGEVSGDRLAPTPLPLTFSATGNVPGGNVISGQVGRSTSGDVDRDYFHITVPEGFEWRELRVGNQVTIGGSQGSFIGLAVGATMPVLPTAFTADGLIGWTLYGPSQATTDILDNMAVGGNGASGFTSPLGAGSYTLWIQETAPGSFNYRFNLILSPVPEPGTAMLGVLGLGALMVARRRVKLS